MIIFEKKQIIIFILFVLSFLYFSFPNTEKTAILLYQSHNYDKSKNIFVDILNKNKNSIPALKHIRDLFLAEGNTIEALKIQQRLVSLKPKLIFYIDKLAQLYDWTNDPYHRLKALEKKIPLLKVKKRIKLIESLATSYQYEKKFKDANRLYGKLNINATPKQLFNMANYYQMTKQAEPAIITLLSLSKKISLSVNQRIKLANLLIFEKQYIKAIEQYLVLFLDNKSLSKHLFTDNFLDEKILLTIEKQNYLEQIITLYNLNSNIALVHKIYKKLIYLYPTKTRYYFKYINYIISKKENPNNLLNQVQTIFSNRTKVLLRLLPIYNQLGNDHKYLEVAHQLEKLNPRNIKYLEIIAKKYQELSNNKLALKYYYKIYHLLKNKNHQTNYKIYIYNIFRNIIFNTANAKSNIKKKREERILLKILQLHDYLGETTKSIVILKKLVILNSNNIKYRSKLAIRYIWINQLEKAFNQMTIVSKRKKNLSSSELFLLAKLYNYKKKYNRSNNYIQLYNDKFKHINKIELLRAQNYIFLKDLKRADSSIQYLEHSQKQEQEILIFLIHFHTLISPNYTKAIKLLNQYKLLQFKKNAYIFELEENLIFQTDKTKDKKRYTTFCNNHYSFWKNKLFFQKDQGYFSTLRNCLFNLKDSDRFFISEKYLNHFPKDYNFRTDLIYQLLESQKLQAAQKHLDILELQNQFNKNNAIQEIELNKAIWEHQHLHNLKVQISSEDLNIYQSYHLNSQLISAQYENKQVGNLSLTHQNLSTNTNFRLKSNSVNLNLYNVKQIDMNFGFIFYNNTPNALPFSVEISKTFTKNYFSLEYTNHYYLYSSKLVTQNNLVSKEIQLIQLHTFTIYKEMTNILQFQKISNRSETGNEFSLSSALKIANSRNSHLNYLAQINYSLFRSQSTILNSIYSNRSLSYWFGVLLNNQFKKLKMSLTIKLGGDVFRNISFLSYHEFNLQLQYTFTKEMLVKLQLTKSRETIEQNKFDSLDTTVSLRYIY